MNSKQVKTLKNFIQLVFFTLLYGAVFQVAQKAYRVPIEPIVFVALCTLTISFIQSVIDR